MTDKHQIRLVHMFRMNDLKEKEQVKQLYVKDVYEAKLANYEVELAAFKAGKAYVPPAEVKTYEEVSIDQIFFGKD